MSQPVTARRIKMYSSYKSPSSFLEQIFDAEATDGWSEHSLQTETP